MRRLSFILALLVFPACGPGAALQPLIGEDDRIAKHMETKPLVLESSAPITQAEHLLTQIRTANYTAVWDGLSPLTQQAITTEYGPKHPSTQGPALLRSLTSSDTLPSEGRTLETLLFSLDVDRIIVEERTRGGAADSLTTDRSEVRVKSPQGAQAKIVFRFIENQWLLHRTSF